MTNARVQELYNQIENAQKELEQIRKECKHTNKSEGNYMWAPGHINTGFICDGCGRYLGEYKTVKDWIKEEIPRYIQCAYGRTEIDSEGKLYVKRLFGSKKEYSSYKSNKKIGSLIIERLDIYNNVDNYNKFGEERISKDIFEKYFTEILETVKEERK